MDLLVAPPKFPRLRRVRAFRRRMFAQPPADDIATSALGLYRWGGAAIAMVGLIFFAVIVFSIALGPAPSATDGYLKAIAAHPTIARANFLVYSTSDLLILPALFALYRALGVKGRRLLIAAGVFLAANLVLDLAVTEYNSLVLVNIAQSYASATSDAQRAAYLVQADSVREALPIGTFLSYVVSSTGYLFAALATLRGAFRKAIGIVGAAGSIIGIVGGFYVVVPALTSLLLPSLAMVGFWAVLVGIRLVRLGRGLPVLRFRAGWRRRPTS